MFLLARPPDERPRLGVSVPRRAGNAVTRNRLRRRLREIFRRGRTGPPLPAVTLVVNVRQGAGTLSFAELAREYQETLVRVLARLARKA